MIFNERDRTTLRLIYESHKSLEEFVMGIDNDGLMDKHFASLHRSLSCLCEKIDQLSSRIATIEKKGKK